MSQPAEFAIHRRAGRTRKVGRGIAFFCLPLIDRCYIIPATAQTVSFAADQITAENQGVEVAGFAVWKVNDPEKAGASFDFSDSAAAIATIGGNLKNVVESAIRHQVAKMSLEDVLRKRGSIILELKQELAYIAGEWGLNIETVEIRTVRVLSEQLFAQMQARFRDAMRLESETSTLETERLLAERRLAQKEDIARQEVEFQQRRFERERSLIAPERELQDAQATLEIARRQHVAALAGIDDETKRRQIATANTENPAVVLAREFVNIAGLLQIKELNLGDDALRSLIRRFGTLNHTQDL